MHIIPYDPTIQVGVLVPLVDNTIDILVIQQSNLHNSDKIRDDVSGDLAQSSPAQCPSNYV